MNLMHELNLTAGALIIMLLSIIIVEGGRIVARARTVPSKRTPFSWTVWASDWVNWMTLALNLLTGVVLISIRDGIAEFGGLTISNPERFDLFFAAVVGSGGQGLWKIVLKVGDTLRSTTKPGHGT